MVVKAKDCFNFLSYISENRLKNIVQDSLETKKKLILKLLYSTGINVKELVLLQPKNISKQTIETYNKKTKQKQTYFLPSGLYSELLEYIVLERLSPENYLFSTSKKHEKPLTPKRVEQICIEIGEKNKIKLTPKVLKDSYQLNKIKAQLKNKDDLSENTNTRTINLKNYSKNLENQNIKTQLLIKLIEENISVATIRNIFVNEQGISNISLEKTTIETKDLFNKLVFEHNQTNQFLFGSKTKPVSQRRIEQILNVANVTIKEIQRKTLLRDLIQKINLEISDVETKKFYDDMLSSNILIVRNSGFLEVYSWQE